jgi:D-citramalate synthase
LGPERFDRKRTYALGKMSGKASLKKNLDELGISLSTEDQAEVLKRIVSLGDSKHTTTVEDLPFLIADVLERKDFRHIELLSCSFTSGMDRESTASIRVEVNGEVQEASGAGNGGFDAFIDAIRKVFPPTFEFPELVDYEVHIPKGGSTSALTEALIIWRDGERTVRTRGVDANQVLAGASATLRMLNMKLHRAAETSEPESLAQG